MTPRRDSCHWRRDSCLCGWIAAQGKGILAAGDLEATPASRNPFPPCSPPVDKAFHRRQAIGVARRVALPLHHVAVTLWGRPIVAGELATTVATNSLRLSSSSSPAASTARPN